jgi:hypothetical protein
VQHIIRAADVVLSVHQTENGPMIQLIRLDGLVHFARDLDLQPGRTIPLLQWAVEAETGRPISRWTIVDWTEARPSARN